MSKKRRRRKNQSRHDSDLPRKRQRVISKPTDQSFLIERTERRSRSVMQDHLGYLEKWVRMCTELNVSFHITGSMPNSSPKLGTFNLSDLCVTEEEETELENRYVFGMKRGKMNKQEFKFIARAMNFTNIDKIHPVLLDKFLGLRNAHDILNFDDVESLDIKNQQSLIFALKKHVNIRTKKMLVFVACAREFRKIVDNEDPIPWTLLRDARNFDLFESCANIHSSTIRKFIGTLSERKVYRSSLTFRTASVLRVLSRIVLRAQTDGEYHRRVISIGDDPESRASFPSRIVVKTRCCVASGFLHEVHIYNKDLIRYEKGSKITLKKAVINKLFDIWSYGTYRTVRGRIRSTDIIDSFNQYLSWLSETLRPAPDGYSNLSFKLISPTDRCRRNLILKGCYYMKQVTHHSCFYIFDVEKETSQYMISKRVELDNRNLPEKQKISLDNALEDVPRHARLTFKCM